LSTSNIINNCINHDIKRLVFTSTNAVYGNATPPFDETYLPDPVDPYGVAKAACEKDIQIAGEQHGLDWCIIRPHNVYGKKQNIWDRYRNVLGIWMYRHLNGMDLPIFGDGEQTRAFSYIDDCLEPFWNAATNESASKQIINLGGTKNYTINQASDILIDVMGGGKKIYLEQRHEVKHAWPTYQKSIDVLNYKENIDLKEGLKEMWNWAKDIPMKKQKSFDKYEVERGIYGFWK